MSQRRIKAALVIAVIAVLAFLMSTSQNSPKAGSQKTQSQDAAAPGLNPAALGARDYANAVNQTLTPTVPQVNGVQYPATEDPSALAYAALQPQDPPLAINTQAPARPLSARGYPSPSPLLPPAPPGAMPQHILQQEARDTVEANNYKREVESLSAGLIVRSERSRTQALPTASSVSTPPATPTAAPASVSEPPRAPAPASAPSSAGDSALDLASRNSRPLDASHSALNRATGPSYRLFEGTFIETVLTNRLDSSFTGPVTCMVTTDVWSHNRQHLLIPQGAKVLGEARRLANAGQARLAVVFHRLIMPDGYSLSLDRFTGLSQIGETGLEDRINHHYAQIFGVSAALGAISGLAVRGASYGPGASGGDAFRQGFSQQLSQEGTQVLDRFLNVLPTVTIREGVRVKVYLLDDLSLPAYTQHKIPSDL